MKTYLDSSAIVKLVQVEAESPALRHFIERHGEDRFVTSMLSRVEVVRAVAPGGELAVNFARVRLSQLDQIGLTIDILDDAASLAAGVSLRSLDAIHLASARVVGDDLRTLVTYDSRMIDAAAAIGLTTQAPT